MRRTSVVRDVDVGRSPGEVASEQDDLTHAVLNNIRIAGEAEYGDSFNPLAKTIYENASGSPQFLENVSTSVHRNAGAGLDVEIVIRDDTDTVQAEMKTLPGDSIVLDPPIKLKDGWDIRVIWNNAAPFNRDIQAAVALRNEVQPR